jgi:hypothetical protein
VALKIPAGQPKAGDPWFNPSLRLVVTISTHVDNDIKAAFSINTTKGLVSKLVEISENPLRKNSIEALSGYIYSKANKRDLIMQNILDLNVVPINVHAFMREVPLANIMNYSYTFERMIVELFYGFQEPEIREAMLNDLCKIGNIDRAHILSPKDLFVALLIDPYLEVIGHGAGAGPALDSKYEFMRRLFKGNSAMELDRPKYLGDQVFNKALFDKLYDGANNTVYRDIGPAAASSPNAPIQSISAAVAQNAAAMHTNANVPAPKYGITPIITAPGAADFNVLTYLTDRQTVKSRANYAAVQTHDLTNIIRMLRATGLLRFDTVLIRNLIFLVNLYRVIRLKLRKDLMYDRNIILKSHAIAREDATEHARNDRWTSADYPPELKARYGTAKRDRI